MGNKDYSATTFADSESSCIKTLIPDYHNVAHNMRLTVGQHGVARSESNTTDRVPDGKGKIVLILLPTSFYSVI